MTLFPNFPARLRKDGDILETQLLATFSSFEIATPPILWSARF